ncbi:MAPEG family protein [Agrilutibacter solisilvae]|uniref:MAPEG family protein n=1 Tax=Agrilutibacter solisilvae TaxID=2763317 RepID=A0A974Y4V9_9GAMM|nr:MAPEG family protein [Lysobacter solisilvae]QSX78181.1 MAPEG family protein [Lysobacter solisilvae]
MSDQQIFYPVLVMAGLTFVVWWRMFFTRVGQMKRERIHPQAVATSAQAASKLTDSRAADNFRNLFELPVLFYLAVVVAAQADLVTPVTVGLAWAFVLMRVLHSWIQCTYNKVMHRFKAYIAGGAALWTMWGVIAWGLLK